MFLQSLADLSLQILNWQLGLSNNSGAILTIAELLSLFKTFEVFIRVQDTKSTK